MTNALKLIDKYVEVCKHPSDSAAARALNVRPSAIANWRSGLAKPSAEAVEKMCDAIGQPVQNWLPLIEAERARTPADKRVWLRLAQTTAALTLMLSFGRLDVHAAAPHVLHYAAHNSGSMYIMSSIRACGRWLARFVRVWGNSHGLRQCPAAMPA